MLFSTRKHLYTQTQIHTHSARTLLFTNTQRHCESNWVCKKKIITFYCFFFVSRFELFACQYQRKNASFGIVMVFVKVRKVFCLRFNLLRHVNRVKWSIPRVELVWMVERVIPKYKWFSYGSKMIRILGISCVKKNA